MTASREDMARFGEVMDERIRISEYLVEHAHLALGQSEGFLAETSDHVLSSPGKLLRPLLLLDACRAAGGDPELVFPAAAGTEYGHIASLIQDDIIDNDDTRRGQETLHTKYNLPVAILTGDFFIFNMFLSYARCVDEGADAGRVVDAIRTLSTTCLEICQGQALEAVIAGRLDTTEQTYLEMIALKTAGVCRAAAWIGAHLGGASEEHAAALGEYGMDLGIAFQLVDDILSYEGTIVHTGKPVHSDMANGRVTLPIIYALQAADPAVRDRIVEIFNSDEPHQGRHAELVEILQATRALSRARALAYRYTTRATHCLDTLPYSEARERLRTLSHIALTRDH